MKNHEITNTTTIDTMMQTAQICVSLAIRARHRNTPTDLLTSLQNAQTADNKARELTAICDRITELEQTRDQYRKDSNKLRNYAKRLTITEEASDIAIEEADRLTLNADRLSDEIEGLYTRLDDTYSDREDLLQEALCKLWELELHPADVTDKLIDEYWSDPDNINKDDIDSEDELQSIANFRACVSYVGKCIGELASPEANNRHTTKSRPATDEEVTDWVNTYGSTDARIPNQIKRTRASECFDTMEFKSYKNTDPNRGKVTGWYRVRHWVTVAPYTYIETYTDRDTADTEQTAIDNLGEIVGYTKSYNPFVTDTGTQEAFEELMQTAKLTDRERTFLEHFFRRCRYSSDFADCKAYAFKQIGITSTSNQSTFFQRLCDHLNPLRKTERKANKTAKA